MEENPRKYGKAPCKAALIHGGPGAAGELASVARKLASICGTLEPMQTEKTIDGQLNELKEILEAHGDIPLILIGHSWGAWLSFLFAARWPQIVQKLILIGSGPFEEKYVSKIMETRLSRLYKEERIKAGELIDALNDPGQRKKNEKLAEFGKLLARTDSFRPYQSENENQTAKISYEIHKSVWREAEELRRSGKLLEQGKHIQCPVIAIHGDYDPHHYEGVKKPLAGVISDFRFILLRNCGHTPWKEREARESFYEVLEAELK